MGQKANKKDASNSECIIGLLGDSMVGKTTLYSWLTQEKLPDVYSGNKREKRICFSRK